jgi:XTP/dITP diphosphohydrolase
MTLDVRRSRLFVLGSRNAHKLGELRALLAPHELIPLPDAVELPPENGASFAENALSKARAAATATGRAALGEDSGVVVPRLGGAPGIHSARYAGPNATDEQNLLKLLRETEDLDDRAAAYVCALALAEPAGEEKMFEARCEGRLARQPQGSGGFGYDPIFLPEDEQDETMATLPPERKNAISHRGKAARLLLDWLESRR